MRLADSLRDELEQDIVTGALRPGERLTSRAWRRAFAVSRTPIREALMQLASGRPHSAPGPARRVRGVARVYASVIERFEVMAALEGACGALAARRLTEDERTRLVEAHEACIAWPRAGTPTPTTTPTSASIHVLYEASHNLYLAEQPRASCTIG